MLSLPLSRLTGAALAGAALLLSACVSPLEEARESHAAGAYAAVVEALQDEDHRDAEAYVLLGEAHVELGELEAAQEALTSARVARDRRPDLEFRTLFGLGNVALLRWDGRSALAYFSDAKVASVHPIQAEGCDDGIAYARELLESEAERDPITYPTARERGLPGPPRAIPVPRAPSAPETASDPPEVIPRAAWGAHAIRRLDAEPMDGITRITIHHTGEPRPVAPASRDEDATRMRRYQQFHVKTRGWADIGYHFVVDPSGRVWQGRELGYQGAHAGNGASNRHNVGIAVMGNFELGPLNDDQKTALEALLRRLIREHRIAKDGLFTHRAIKKKYELPGTACPGEHLIRYVEQLREELSSEFSSRARRLQDERTAARFEELGSPCLDCGHERSETAAR